MNNLDEFAFDRYASHIIRTCLQCVAGVRVAANVARSKKATGNKMEETVDGLEAAPSAEGLEVLELASEKVLEFEDKKGEKICLFIFYNLVLKFVTCNI